MYDGDCGFCTSSAAWLDRHGDCEIVPWQSLDLEALGLSEADVSSAAYWLDESGRPTARGAGAIAESLKTCGQPWKAMAHLIELRPVRPLADVGYALVARNRHRLPGSTDACRLNP